MDLDDKLIHYLLIGGGFFIGGLVKKGFDMLAERFWDTEFKAFQQWKKEQEVKK